MAKKKTPKPDDGLTARGQSDPVYIEPQPGETVGRTLARIMLDPQARNALLATTFNVHGFGDAERPKMRESNAVMAEQLERTGQGDLSLASRIHTAQALSLDALFTEMARRAYLNMGQYPEAAERYMRLALKAQSACRTTLEALARLHQPREQTVKHVHVNDGGQAVVADHINMGGQGIGKPLKQSDATSPTGASTTLPRPDPLRDGMPIASGERQAAMQDARRDEPGSA